ncbi:hypothetical protein H8S61_00585 [Eggerthella sp. NSJ-70]|uniref:Uncharacterized protein n=1 Tax=Eggerthella hominis TaxID=2763043 RepID=A0ABR7BM71_9ACTN|nr:hypothetical protein [Eggerthella hominis]MBC5582697.1 hypothetical protein [Eggerthella hominis]
MKARKRPAVPAFAVASYAAGGILTACFVLAAVATWANVSAQLAKGVPVQGNELAIANAVLSGCASYAAFAFLAFAAGTLYRGLDRRAAIAPDDSDGDAPAEPEADEDAFWDEDARDAGTPDDERAEDVEAFVRSADLNRVFGARQTVTLDQALKGVYVR